VSDLMKLAIGAAVLGLIVLGVYVWTSTTDVHSVTVTAQEAFYEVPVEDYQPRQLSGWDETVPSDAYNRSESRRKRSETCNKIGKVNVCSSNYDTWVSYTADRWQLIRIATAAYHSAEENLQCPNPDVKEDVVVKHGSQRALPCVKNYSVGLQDGDKSYSCAANSDAWFDMPIGTKLSVKVGRFTQVPWCDTLGGDE
jgi:hypothetical protein